MHGLNKELAHMLLWIREHLPTSSTFYGSDEKLPKNRASDKEISALIGSAASRSRGSKK